MINNLSHKKSSVVYKKKRRLKRYNKTITKKNCTLSLLISFGLIIIFSFFITYNMYIYDNSRDLGFAVEHSFTTGFSSKDKLLRVQKMSLIYSNDETAIVEASGLAKDPPHQSMSIRGNFKKDNKNSWHLDKFVPSYK